MTAEWVTAISSLATFIVIAATAAAALIQLRHMRNSNQITVINEILRKMDSPDFREKLDFVWTELPSKFEEAPFRRRMLDVDSDESRRAREVGNFFDGAVAPLVKHGMVDRDGVRFAS